MPPNTPPHTAHQFFGRRRGRRLRAGRQRLVDELLPEIEINLPDNGEILDLDACFGDGASSVWLEVGFGAGEHLAWQAKENPDKGMIGVEPYINGIARMLAYIDEERLTNVRIFPDDVRPLLACLPDSSLERVFILFPDPWPKTRHSRRRIINPETLNQFARTMTDKAELRVASDDLNSVRWALFHLSAHGDFRWLANGPNDWKFRPNDWPATRYEEKMLSQGRAPTFLRFERRQRAKGHD